MDRYSSDLNFSNDAIGLIFTMISNIVYMVFFQLISFPPARTAFAFIPGHLIIILVLCVAGIWLFRKVFKENRAARFYTAAMLLSAVPFSVSGSHDRILFWVGAAAFGLLGVAATYYKNIPGKYFVQKIVLGILIISNLFVSLYLYIPTLSEYAKYDIYPQAIEKSVAFGNTIFINTPLEQYFLFPATIRYARHEIWPDHLYLLYAGRNEIRVKKIDSCTIEINVKNAWVSSLSTRAFLPRNYRFRKGDCVKLEKMTVTVTECNTDGCPVQVRFFIPEGLDSFTWMRWGTYGPKLVQLPEVNCDMIVSLRK
jgi:hypothetical protein